MNNFVCAAGYFSTNSLKTKREKVNELSDREDE